MRQAAVRLGEVGSGEEGLGFSQYRGRCCTTREWLLALLSASCALVPLLRLGCDAHWHYSAVVDCNARPGAIGQQTNSAVVTYCSG